MGSHSVKKTSWILITLLPLVFIVHVDGRQKVVTTPSNVKTTSGKTQKTTLSPYNATQEQSRNNTLDYGRNYYKYPVGFFLTYNDIYGLGAYNATYNDTYGLGAYNVTYNDTYGLGAYNVTYNDTYGLGAYYNKYYEMNAYPEFGEYYEEMVDNSTKNVNPTLSTRKHEKGTKKPKTNRSKRKPRTLPEENNIKHLCILNLLNVTNIFDKYIHHIFECKDGKSKQMAYLSSKGFIKSCYLLKDDEKPEVPLCIKKGDASYVTTCNSSEIQSFCFTDPNRILICNDKKHRICFNGGLTICNNQENRRVPREIVEPQKDEKRPDVNCTNCEMEVKMLVDEMDDNSPPRVQIKVSKLDPLEKMMDIVDMDFDK